MNKTNSVLNPIENKIDSITEDEFYERLALEVFEQSDSDEEPYSSIGRNLMEAYKANPDATDRVLMAITGWKMESILTMARIIKEER